MVEERSEPYKTIIYVSWLVFFLLIIIIPDYGACEYIQADQWASCIKGCQFASQPTFNITSIENQHERIILYSDCSALCDERYETKQ